MRKETAWRDMMPHQVNNSGPRGRGLPIDGEEKGKMFVGGLSWESSQESLQQYFGKYGDVIDCVVMKNSESGRSRGFGFVTFSDPTNVDVVLQNGPHELDGRTIDPKACNPRSMQKQKRNGNWPKVFLGGLPSNLTETDLRTFFSRFGTVMEVVIMFDQEKKKSRGFGFLSFESDDSVQRAVSEHFVNINGKQVEIKIAEPRDANKAADGSDAQWGSPTDSQWTMHSMAPPGMPGLNNGMGPPSSMPPPMGPPMGPPNSQMGGPGIVQNPYQGWAGTSPQQQAYTTQGTPYGPPQGPQGYQSYGQVHQWGTQYGSPQGSQFGSFEFNAGGDLYRNAPPHLVAGAPSPSMPPGGPPPGNKTNDEYPSWAQFSYTQVPREAATFNRAYNSSGPSQGPPHPSGHPRD